MPSYDALVVGAGPAGSTAAYRLAGAGARVLLVDRARFPRDKPCGGGVTGRAARLLPFSIEPVVEERVVRMELRLDYGPRFVRQARAPIAFMTQRRRLDAFLVERAAAAGAEVRDGVRVEELRPDGAVVDGEEVAARVVLGADGCNGTAARALGLAGDVLHGVALEADAPRLDGRFGGRMVFEVASVPGGYGWIFPKADHVNVGVFGWRSEAPRLRTHLDRLCRAYGLDPVNVKGYRLPMRRRHTGIARGTAAVIGDAAGLVDPFSGDGMYEAILSARLAADAALDLLAGRAAGMEAYETEVARRIGPLTRAGWGAKAAFDRFPRTTFALARLPLTWRALEKILLGTIGHPGETRGAERAAIRAIYALARHAG